MTPIDPRPIVPPAVPVITGDLVAVFDRLAAVARSSDASLASAAMDADLILRAGLPAGAVEDSDQPDADAPDADAGHRPVGPGGGDPEQLLREAVDVLDRRAATAATPAEVLADTAAVERVVTALAGRESSRVWLAARAERWGDDG